MICIDTLQHLSPAGADHRALADFARVLRPGGLAYLRTNSALGRAPLKGVDPNLYRRYRRPELVGMFKKEGFLIERATYVNFLPSVWGSLREYLAPPPAETRAIGPGLAINLPASTLRSRLMYRVLKGEAWVIGRLGIDLGFGHSLAVLARLEEDRTAR